MEVLFFWSEISAEPIFVIKKWREILHLSAQKSKWLKQIPAQALKVIQYLFLLFQNFLCVAEMSTPQGGFSKILSCGIKQNFKFF